MGKKLLIFAGILYTLLYIGLDALSAMIYPGYSYTDQAISELSAIGAPTAPLWTAMIFVLNPLLIAFGIGVLRIAKKRSLRLTGILIIIWGFLGFVWLFFPMNMRGNIGSTSDTGHLVMSGLTVLLMTIIVSVGSGAFGKYFRLYSILTIVIMLSFSVYVRTQATPCPSRVANSRNGDHGAGECLFSHDLDSCFGANSYQK